MDTLGYFGSVGGSIGGGGGSDNDTFDRNWVMTDWDKNGNSSSENGYQEQQLSSFSNIQQREHRQKQAVPLTTKSQNDFQEVNSGPMYSQIDQPQHILRHNQHSGKSERLESLMHLENNNKTFEVENHRSMSAMEQDHSIDMLLAKELNQLSFQERNDINEEIHGVSSLYSVDETPHLISQSIEEMRFEIDHNIPIHRKVAYERSQQIYNRNLGMQEQQGKPCVVSSASSKKNWNNSKETNSYVNDPNFLVLFLRRERFVVQKAALRLVNFMELVYELWGEISLIEKVWESQSYLTNFEREVFRTGLMQCLQGRDRAGRRILGNFAVDNAELSVQNRLRLSLFCAMAVLEDVETQKKGAVGVTMWHNVSIDDFHKRGQCHKQIRDAFPIRVSAIHLCLPDGNCSRNDSKIGQASNPHLMRLIKAMFVMSIGAENRPHMRVHIGTIVECMYALQSFGILPEQIPLNTTSGEVKTKQHLKWLELRLQRENSLKENKPFNKIECPMIKDVLFGRGWPIMKHPGNVMLRNIIDSKLDEYQNEKTKRGKTLIAYSVVCMVKQKGNGGRFLKEDSGWWVEVSNDLARQKVSIAFRDARKLKSNVNLASIGYTNGENKNDRVPHTVTQEKADSLDVSSNVPAVKRKEEDRNEVGQYLHPTNDSSTSAFLGMDGVTGIKRQCCFRKNMPL